MPRITRAPRAPLFVAPITFLMAVTSMAAIHVGNPTTQVFVEGDPSWTLFTTGLAAAKLEMKDCASNTWSATDEVVDASGAPLGWRMLAGTWCAVAFTWTNEATVLAFGPEGREIDATVELGKIEIVLNDPLTLTTATASERQFWLRMGDGGWLGLAEAMLDPDETLVITPGATGHTALRNQLRAAWFVEDADGNGAISAYEVLNHTLGKSG